MPRSSPIILVDEVLLLIPKSLLCCPPPDPCRLVVFLHHSLITGAGLHVSGSDASAPPRLHAVLAPLERVYENPAGLPPAKGFQR